MKRGFSAKLAVLLLCIAGAALYGSLSSSASTPKPTESGFKVSPNVVGNGGGSVLLSAKVINATTCIFLVSPAVSGFAYNHVCSSGTVSYKAILPKNTSISKKIYSFRVEVKGKAGQANVVSPTVTATVNASAASGGGGSSGPTKAIATIPVAADPDALLQVGNEIWVAGCSDNMVSVINLSNMQVIQNYPSNNNYQLDCPDALAYVGGYVWIANASNNTLVQVNASDGSWVQTLTGSYILSPVTIAVSGTNIWVANAPSHQSNFVSEFNAINGNELHVTQNTIKSALTAPTCIAVLGTDIWVSDSGDNVADEFNSVATYIRKTSGGPGASGIQCVSYHSGYIWITSTNNNKIIEYNAQTGTYVRAINNIISPNQLIFNGSNVFVVSVYPDDTVYEYSTSGTLIKTFLKVNLGNLRPLGLALLTYGNSLWVANPANNTVALYNI